MQGESSEENRRTFVEANSIFDDGRWYVNVRSFVGNIRSKIQDQQLLIKMVKMELKKISICSYWTRHRITYNYFVLMALIRVIDRDYDQALILKD